jgi:two-component system, cell cycle response regulator DivK
MSKTVMIVEDNELNMKLFHDLLEAHGYHTVGTRNGIEALDLARNHRPDLILMDIQLPEVSGLEVPSGSRKTLSSRPFRWSR